MSDEEEHRTHNLFNASATDYEKLLATLHDQGITTTTYISEESLSGFSDYLLEHLGIARNEIPDHAPPLIRDIAILPNKARTL